MKSKRRWGYKLNILIVRNMNTGYGGFLYEGGVYCYSYKDARAVSSFEFGKAKGGRERRQILFCSGGFSLSRITCPFFSYRWHVRQGIAVHVARF